MASMFLAKCATYPVNVLVLSISRAELKIAQFLSPTYNLEEDPKSRLARKTAPANRLCSHTWVISRTVGMLQGFAPPKPYVHEALLILLLVVEGPPKNVFFTVSGREMCTP